MNRPDLPELIQKQWPNMPPDFREQLVEFVTKVDQLHFKSLQRPGEIQHECDIADACRVFLSQIVFSKKRAQNLGQIN